jgi:formate dehydrogenase iron-sulfur subunit
LQNLFVIRIAVLAVAGVVLPLIATRTSIIAVAFAAALAGEWLGRYLFFVSVVPKNIAAAFTSGERRAA